MWMGQWTTILSKTAPQSRICVKSRAIPHSEVALNWLIKPAVGRDMRQEKGQTDCQITESVQLWVLFALVLFLHISLEALTKPNGK